MNKQPIRVIDGNAQPFAPFWQVRNAAETGGDAEVDLIGPISEFSWMGDEVTPKKFKDDLYAAGNGGPVLVRLHSGGGDIFAASTIRSILAEYPGKVTVNIMGLCASAAVGVALAADEVNIYDTAYFMIHNPAYMFFGAMLDADVMRKMADDLVVFKDGILNAYESATGLSRDELSAMMDAETWMTAQEAVDKGFAHHVIGGGRKVDMKNAVKNFVNVPSVLLNAAVIEPEEDEAEDGQAPAVVEVVDAEAQARRDANRSRLDQAKNFVFGETPMNIREVQKAHAAKVERAQALMQLTETEARDFTAEEQTEFDTCLTEAEDLSGKIVAFQERKTRLQAQIDGVSVSGAADAEKPESNASAKRKTLTRAEYDALNSTKKAEFSRAGGKIEN
ncbi:MAG: Clp protease ClpP [Anaerolineae bacterium]|nr:Clp protease ClpP [Anaerolineae bacterium]